MDLHLKHQFDPRGIWKTTLWTCGHWLVICIFHFLAIPCLQRRLFKDLNLKSFKLLLRKISPWSCHSWEFPHDWFLNPVLEHQRNFANQQFQVIVELYVRKIHCTFHSQAWGLPDWVWIAKACKKPNNSNNCKNSNSSEIPGNLWCEFGRFSFLFFYLPLVSVFYKKNIFYAFIIYSNIVYSYSVRHNGYFIAVSKWVIVSFLYICFCRCYPGCWSTLAAYYTKNSWDGQFCWVI